MSVDIEPGVIKFIPGVAFPSLPAGVDLVVRAHLNHLGSASFFNESVGAFHVYLSPYCKHFTLIIIVLNIFAK